MVEILEILERILKLVVEIAIVLFEYVGVAVIVIAGIKGLILALKRDYHAKIEMGEGLTLGLGFLMRGEILRTVIANDFREIEIVAGIVVLRIALTLLLHWEMKNEKKELKEEEEHKGHS